MKSFFSKINVVLFSSIALCSTALAATPQAQPSLAEGLKSMLPMLIVFVLIFYFLLIRPQQKRQKAHQALMMGIKSGDEVVTNSGILGKVVSVADDYMLLTIAENVDVNVQKSAVTTVLPKGTMKAVKSH